MYDIKSALRKLYPWATDIDYVSKKGALKVNVEYRNPHKTKIFYEDEFFVMFCVFLLLHGIGTFLCLCLIPNPILANTLFIVLSLGIGITACTIGETTKGETVIVWGTNLIFMLIVILCTWQMQACEPNKIPSTLPKIFDVLCKFKF